MVLWGAEGRPRESCLCSLVGAPLEAWRRGCQVPGGCPDSLGASWGLTGTTPGREESPGKGVGTAISSDHKQVPLLPLVLATTRVQGRGLEGQLGLSLGLRGPGLGAGGGSQPGALVPSAAVPVPARPRGEDGGVQALAARAVQEGRPVPVPAPVRPLPDARVLLLLQVR